METQTQTKETEGREAGVAELERTLPSAPGEYLAGAIENPRLTAELVVLILRNRSAGTETLRRIASEPKWTRSYEVKRGLVKHPHTPNAIALNLVKFLFWKDLADTADDAFVFPPLRRRAENLLAERLPEMALGEKITFSRVAGRGLIPRLLEETHPLVLEGTLWNGRVTTSDVLAAASRPTSRPEILEAISRHPRWSSRRDVRLALLRNPRTPTPVSLGLLGGASPEELRSVAELPTTPRIVRLACVRLLSRKP